MYGTVLRSALYYKLYQGWVLILLVLSPLLRTSGSSLFLPNFQAEVIAHWKTTHCLSQLSMNKYSQKRPSQATGNICLYLFSISINYILKSQLFHSPLWWGLAEASLVLRSTAISSLCEHVFRRESTKPVTQMTKHLQAGLMRSELNSFSLWKLTGRNH